MNPDSRIYVAGGNGLVGSAVVRRLRDAGFTRVASSDIGDFDLTDPVATDQYFADTKPEYVFLAAAKVGGIKANDTYPADFIRVNLQIQTNVVDAAHRHGVEKLLFLGSSCIYPKLAPQPMSEEHLLSGKLEATNDSYAIAKIAGLIMCASYNRQHNTRFIAAMPTNLYGPGDNFDLETSHALPGMIHRLHQAREQGREAVTLWGTGTPRREFLYVDDLAGALVFMMHRFEPTREEMFANVGVGKDISLVELAGLIKDVVGYRGEIEWDTSMPDGTPRKLLDVSRLTRLGWTADHSLRDGIEKTYGWFVKNYNSQESNDSK